MSDIQERLLNASLPIVVRASAGTGKTYTLVNKVNSLIDSGINPANILAFTFTVDSAGDLKKRISQAELMTVGTIHSVMLQIIREHSPKRYYVIDNGRQQAMVYKLFKEMKIDFDKYGKYMGLIDLAKNTFTDYYDLLSNNSEHLNQFFGENGLTMFARSYEKEKERCHKIDFSDFVLKAYWLLKDNPNILDSRQERWKYIFVDEAQDLCVPQIDIIKLLGEKYRNIFIVGDFKQGIYQFRNSTSEYLENFTKIYPEANEFVLPTTYRCSHAVCQAGNKVAHHIDKSVINTNNPAAGQVMKNTTYETQHDEADAVCQAAIDEFNAGKSVRILYRTNAQSLVYQTNLITAGVPFSISQAGSIFNSREVRLALACCKLAHEYHDLPISEKADIIKQLNLILRNKWEAYGLARTMTKLDECPLTSPASYPDHRGIIDEIISFRDSLNTKTPSQIFFMVAGLIEVNERLMDTLSNNSVDNLLGLSEFVSGCKNMKEIDALIEQIQRPRTLLPGERAISLSTIHGAKGLEADVIYLTGVADGLFPHSMSERGDELNLLYVGVTRARESLHISGFKQYGNREFDSHSFAGII